MNAAEAYHHLGTPTGLQRHMITVAGLVCALRDHWTGAAASGPQLKTTRIT